MRLPPFQQRFEAGGVRGSTLTAELLQKELPFWDLSVQFGRVEPSTLRSRHLENIGERPTPELEWVNEHLRPSDVKETERHLT